MLSRWPRSAAEYRSVGVAHWSACDWVPGSGNIPGDHAVIRLAMQNFEAEIRGWGLDSAEGILLTNAATYTKAKIEQWKERTRRCTWCTGFSHSTYDCQHLRYLQTQMTVVANANLWRTFRAQMIGVVDGLLYPRNPSAFQNRRRAPHGN